MTLEKRIDRVRYQACSGVGKLVNETWNLILYQANSIYFPWLLLANVWRRKKMLKVVSRILYRIVESKELA